MMRIAWIMRGAIVALAASAACGGSPTSAASPASPASSDTKPAGSPARPPQQWWCYVLGNEDLGSCFEQKVACQAARVVMVNSSNDPNEQITECTPRPNAACFVTLHSGGASEPTCHPTLAMCRDHADFKRREPAVKSVTPCVASDAAAAPTDDSAWWCISFAAGKIGSCSRSKQRCGDDRNKAIELEQGQAVNVTPCTPAQKAYCFETATSGGGTSPRCHPTIQTCRSALGYAKRDGRTADVDCQAVE